MRSVDILQSTNTNSPASRPSLVSSTLFPSIFLFSSLKWLATYLEILRHAICHSAHFRCRTSTKGKEGLPKTPPSLQKMATWPTKNGHLTDRRLPRLPLHLSLSRHSGVGFLLDGAGSLAIPRHNGAGSYSTGQVLAPLTITSNLACQPVEIRACSQVRGWMLGLNDR